jgi:hypothetical protein
VKQIAHLCLASLVCVGLAWPAVADDAAPGVSFTWALAALRGQGLDGTWVKITDDDSATASNDLQAGDKLKMMVEILNPCFVYVLRLDSEERLEVLFPSKLPHRMIDSDPGTRHFIPQEGWLKLGAASGEETFYVVAADQRLGDLERSLGEYETASSDAARELKLEATLDLVAELQAKHVKQARAMTSALPSSTAPPTRLALALNDR